MPRDFLSSTPRSWTIPKTVGIPAITLSYTFHVSDMPEDYAALEASEPAAAN